MGGQAVSIGNARRLTGVRNESCPALCESGLTASAWSDDHSAGLRVPLVTRRQREAHLNMDWRRG